MANIVEITATMDDGSSVVLFPVAAPVAAAAPAIAEIDVKESDGTVVVATPTETSPQA